MKKLILFISLISLNLSAKQIPNTSGAVSAATGGAGIALVDTDDSAFLNPASIPLFRRKEVSLSYSSERFAASIVDNGVDAAFPAGLGYEKYSNDAFKNNIYHLILAYGMSSKSVGVLSFGANFNYSDLQFTGSETSYKQTRADIGILWKPVHSLGFGFVHKNMALTDTDLSDDIDHVTTTTLGASYVYENFAQLRFDIDSIEKKPAGRYIYKIGLETYINDWIITRFGYRNDNVSSMNFTTLGLGFAGPQFGLHYAYQTEANSQLDPLHIIDLSFPF